MKIAVFYNLPAGGAKRTLVEQVKYLSKKHKVDIFTLSDQKKEKKESKKPLVMDVESHANKVFEFHYHSLRFGYELQYIFPKYSARQLIEIFN